MDNISEELLLKYLKGECTEDDWRKINLWLSESKNNERELFLMEEAFHSGEKEYLLSSECIENAKARLFAEIEKCNQPKKAFFHVNPILRYAAMIIIILTFGTIGVTYIARYLSIPKEIIISVSDKDQVKEVQLPDGSMVWLNHSTVLKYPESFAKGNRQVILNGEAYFEVKKDKSKPFIVSSDAMQIKVLGTVFNLKSSKYAKMAEVTLIEGLVEVKGNRDEGHIVLSPGQKAELNRNTGRLVVKQVNAKLDAVWRDNLIPFEKATISEIANTLEYFYKVKVVLSPDIDENTYSGVLRKRGSIDSVLNSLKNAIPINYKISKTNVVYIQPSHKK
ncbi:FecR domain-containing protein [uncultured Bacteroides sp.]|uniref:FecR family protein n=1 Tax=uncultured Bacteroides sp. TaxID=162156 RepID=UPI002AAB3691|nr:FecR domain-containing protein [uncultured Bacteroides sp.]